MTMVKGGGAAERHRAKPMPRRRACACASAARQGAFALGASRSWAVKETRYWALIARAVTFL